MAYTKVCVSVYQMAQERLCVCVAGGNITMSAQAEGGCTYLSLETLELVACAKDTGVICHQYA